MNPLLDSITGLRDQWLSLQPLAPEPRDRLWRKFRLEWNYHSNHIEGNTLTYGETELLLLHDRTTGNHTHREYVEMKAHDIGIEHVRTLAADSARVITEADIRDLNRIILKEPFWKHAETADGQPTRKQIIPGQYKTSPNNVRTASGDMFYFASVENTPPGMQALVAWLQGELETPTLHTVALAAKLHHEFVLIHPFDDGNGRVARMLVNYVLLRTGHLPVVVRTGDKANYLTALQLADAGDIAALTGYLGRLAEWSLNLGIRAARGESIEEPDDVEKEVAVFVREQKGRHVQSESIRRSPQVLRELFDLGLKGLVESFVAKLSSFSPLFACCRVGTHPPSAATSPASTALEQVVASGAGGWLFQVAVRLDGYKSVAPEPFSMDVVLGVKFDELQFSVSSKYSHEIKRPYSNPILADEAEELANRILAVAFAEIKRRSGAVN